MTPEEIEKARAPERIWIDAERTYSATAFSRGISYIRLDLHDAEIARLTAERDEWQSTASGLATQLTACEAEARHARKAEWLATTGRVNAEGAYIYSVMASDAAREALGIKEQFHVHWPLIDGQPDFTRQPKWEKV